MSKTDISLYFANPTTPDHKKYEVLRALFYEKLPKKEVTEKFGYTNYTLNAIIRLTFKRSNQYSDHFY